MLPQELGCGSGMTCWRRLRDWQEAGVWERLHQALLDQLGHADQIDWSRACLDSASISAKKQWSCRSSRGERTGGIPAGATAQQGVEDGQELVHAGSQRHFLRLASGEQARVEGAQHRVVANGDQGAHPERGTHLAPPTPDDAAAS